MHSRYLLSRQFACGLFLLLGLTLYLVLGVGYANASGDREKLTLGVFAYLGVEETQAKYAPLVAYLNQTLRDEYVELKVLTQAEINQGLAERGLDIVTTNPTHFLVTRKEYPLTGVIATLVTAESGKPLHQLAGAIITLASRSDINRLEDVRGKRIATPSLKHMGGYRAQAYELFNAGVHLPRDVASIVETETHQAAVQMLLDGGADVAFARDGILERMIRRGELQPGQVKLINPVKHESFPYAVSTRLYPEWPVFALPHVPEKMVRHFAAALFALEPDHPAAKAAGIYGYTVPADYLSVEEMARTLRLPPFDQTPQVTLRDIWAIWWPVMTGGGLALMVILLLAGRLVVLARRERQASIRTQLLLETLGEGVFGTDLNGRGTFMNRSAHDMLGFSESEVLGNNLHALFHARYEDGSEHLAVDCPVHQTASDGVLRRSREWFTRKDGRGFPVEQVVNSIRVDGKIVGTVVAFQDVSDRKQTEVLQQQAREEAERARQNAVAANQSKSAFLANMSHEIRTPMNGILGMAQLLLAPSMTDAERLDYASTILGSGETLLTLLNDILDLSKVEAGKLELAPVVFSPGQLVHEIHLLFTETAARKSLQLERHWAGVESQRYRADSHRLRQMLSNLVGNAIKFTQQGRVRIEACEIARDEAGAVLEFSVTDTGVGVSPDQRELLFKPFSQADASITRQYGGTGLGLSIVRSLATMMGGDVGLDSESGRGSRFWFRIRAARVASDEESHHAQPPRSAIATSSRPTGVAGNVLVVEDNATNRKVIEAMLSRFELEVSSAQDGRECVERIKAGERPDLILMDVQMPVMDGFEATRQIRRWETAENQPRIPIVALTANAFEQDRQDCISAGMDDFLAKPLDLKILPGVLSKWLAQEPQQMASTRDLAALSIVPESPEAPAESIFVEHDLLALIGGDRDLARDIVRATMNDIPVSFATLEAAVTSGNREEAGRAAHTMKGIFAQVGSPRLAAHMKEVETGLKSGTEISLQTVTDLKNDYHLLAAALADWLDR